MIKNYLIKILRVLRKLHSILVQKKVLVLGDSHAKVFEHWLFLVRFPFTSFNVCSVQGATASGLENPRSKTQAYNYFNRALIQNKKAKYIIIMLGEVDTGFVIWYRAKKYNKPVEEALESTLTIYTAFIESSRQYGELIVISAALPTITDEAISAGEVANLRKEVAATQKERTKLAIDFNSGVQQYCKKTNIIYISLDSDSLGEDGFVKKTLINKNIGNHHYDKFH